MTAHSSSGLGRGPLTAETRVRFPDALRTKGKWKVGIPYFFFPFSFFYAHHFRISPLSYINIIPEDFFFLPYPFLQKIRGNLYL